MSGSFAQRPPGGEPHLPRVIGLTVVAFGTSAPELAVTVQAGIADQADIAVGNIVRSNIFNVLFILGVSALIVPLVVSQQLARLDVPLMIGVSVLLLVMALDGRIGGFDGLLLIAGIVAYTVFALRQSRKESAAVQAEYAREYGAGKLSALKRLPIQIALIAAGLALLVLGAHWLVGGAVAIARLLGVSELIIGLTIVAADTSLPEVATSVVAALRGERDIAVGNVIGSGLFNILAIAGIAAVVTPGGLEVAPALIRFDIPVMIAVALACLPIARIVSVASFFLSRIDTLVDKRLDKSGRAEARALRGQAAVACARLMKAYSPAACGSTSCGSDC